MHRKFCLGFMLLGSTAAYVPHPRVGISPTIISTLVFQEAIEDVELGSQSYHVKVKGRYLLLRAKHEDVKPTSLFVRYGKKKHQYYVAEIFPDKNGALQYLIQESDNQHAPNKQPTTQHTLLDDTQQEYYDIGIRKHKIGVILTKILHIDRTTVLQLFINNASSVDFCLTQWTFEYVTLLKKSLPWATKKKYTLVDPIDEPAEVKVAAQQSVYIEFHIPTYITTGGLSVFLGEEHGERDFKFLIPNRVLLKAKKSHMNAKQRTQGMVIRTQQHVCTITGAHMSM